MARRKETVTLDDPRALRALAHPARQRLVHELFGGRVLTATEAAELVGLSPSAVSHHLRALEKWGLAKRVAGSKDGRERPWQGTGRSLRLKAAEGPARSAALETVGTMIVNEFTDQLGRFMQSSEGDPWQHSHMSQGEIWLTQDERTDLSSRMQALLDEYQRGRSYVRHPRDAYRTAFTWTLLPVERLPKPDDEST